LTLKVDLLFHYAKNLKKTNKSEQSLNDQGTITKDQTNPTTKTFIFSTQGQNDNLIVAIYNKLCLVLNPMPYIFFSLI